MFIELGALMIWRNLGDTCRHLATRAVFFAGIPEKRNSWSRGLTTLNVIIAERQISEREPFGRKCFERETFERAIFERWISERQSIERNYSRTVVCFM